MSKIFIRLFIFLLLSALLFAGSYTYWTTTPLFAFQEATVAVKSHDLAKFERYVDSQKVVDSALNDLLINPIESMPGLNEMGRRVAVAAIGLSVAPAEKSLLRQIQILVLGSHQISTRLEERQASSPLMFVSYNTAGDVSNVLAVTRQEVGGEFEKLRQTAYIRMQNYALSHQQGLIGRFFSMANNPRQANVAALLAEYGLVPENFRGLAYCNTTDDGSGENCKTGFKFKSPKVSREVVLEVELTRGSGNWRVARFSNLEQLIETLDPSYSSDFQSLIRSSVQGINSRSAKSEVSALSKRITESAAVKNFLRRLQTRTTPDGSNTPN